MNETAPVRPQDIAPAKSIGVPTPLVDGPEKVSGKALYTADFVEKAALVGRGKRRELARAMGLKNQATITQWIDREEHNPSIDRLDGINVSRSAGSR